MSEPSAWRRLKEQLSGALELPQDVVMNLPRVVVTGGLQLQIENHKGVVEYTPSKIRVATARGEVVVTGAKLSILTIHQQELAVSGRIDNVQLLQ
ncbi:MAG: sporulation protein YqfC [Kiritimatiellia bacterium]